MSLILEALRKAEQERNRQGGPGLHAVQLAARRQGLPGWAVLIGVVLVANLLALGWLLLRPAPPAPTVAAAPVPAAAAPALPASPLPDPAQPGTPLPAAVAPATTAGPLDATPLPPETLPATPAAADSGEPPPLRRPVAAPAPARPATAEPLERLPSAADLGRNGTRLPALRLSLHVYDPDPALRYVLLNALQLHEGDVTPDGLRLERITETGVVLAWRGQRFTLQPGD